MKDSENTLLLECSLTTGFFIYISNLMKCVQWRWQGVQCLSFIYSCRVLKFGVLFWWCLTNFSMKRPIDLCYGSSFGGLFCMTFLNSPLFYPSISFTPDHFMLYFSTLSRLNVTIMTTMDLMI